MLSTRLSEKQYSTMSKLATWLLSRLANPTYRDELIGDLQEEYIERQQTSQNAGNWLLRQTSLAIWDGQKAMIRTTGFVKALSIILCLVALPTIALFVGWLSNMHMPSDHLWQLLMRGEVHYILFNSEYWRIAWNESGVSHLDFMMFMHVPSILWALAFAGSAYLFLKKPNPSVWIFTTLSLVLTLVPYLFGYGMLSLLQLSPQDAGPILAFMVLAPFFTLPTYVCFLFKGFAK